MGKSLAQEIAELSPEEQEKALDGINPEQLLHDWGFWSRPEQRQPAEGDWTIWATVAGRGFGKTRMGAEWVREKAAIPNTRIALVARTSADARDVMVEGESGILNVDPLLSKDNYQSSIRRITWPNGSVATTFSAAEPDQIRGPQFHFAWCDEMAAWNHVPGIDGATAWDNTQIATRLRGPETNKVLATTTPKRLPAMTELLAREGKDTIVTRGATLDNAGNLQENYLKFIYGLYRGTRLEQQELYGIMLDDVEGALWSSEIIDASRVESLPNLPYRVIAVDPSVAEEPTDECGIIVAGATGNKVPSRRHAYIIEDASIHGAPAVWAKQVAKMYDRYRCPVIAETNQGSALVAHMIHSINPNIPVLEVRAYKGKAVRAEPVLLKYDQGKVHHYNYHGDLESQMTSWIPFETRKSPDRIDALVYAVLGLLVDPPRDLGGVGLLRARSAAQRQLDIKSRSGHPVSGRGRR